MPIDELERFGLDAVDLSMLRSGDRLGSATGAKWAAAIERLLAERDELRAAISTPEAVHANMLRGGIPMLTIRQALHLHGADALATWDNAKAAEARRARQAGALSAAVGMCEQYAEFIRGVPAAEIERHPYLPELEQVIAVGRAEASYGE